jgi:hypothetical protein
MNFIRKLVPSRIKSGTGFFRIIGLCLATVWWMFKTGYRLKN